MAADAGVARKETVELEGSTHGALGCKLHAQLAHVSPPLEAMAADQLRKRTVDGVRAIPPHWTAPPTPDIGHRVEDQTRKDVLLCKGIDVIRTEPEATDPGRKRLRVAGVLPS